MCHRRIFWDGKQLGLRQLALSPIILLPQSQNLELMEGGDYLMRKLGVEFARQLGQHRGACGVESRGSIFLGFWGVRA